MQQPDAKIIISGGGTGGHIFPAIAIANALKNKKESIDILFVGAKGKMEMEKVPAAGYPIVGLWISGLQRSLTLKNLSFPLKLISSLIRAGIIIHKFKPDIVVGVGGYASGPTLKMAIRKGIPTLIQEQNSYPGITNKLLAKKANKICVAYENMEHFFPLSKIVITGNPVRQDLLKLDGKREKSIEYFGLSKNKKTLLIVGGSQGALSINKSIADNLELLTDNNFQFIWQTGKYYHNTAKEVVQNYPDNRINVYEFITKMDYAYSAADLIISRAGAIAISELCIVGKPVIFIPLPGAAEDHQTKNAMCLVDKQAAILIKDKDAKEKLGKEVINLLADEKMQDIMSKNIKEMALLNSADTIADEILKLIK